VKRRNSTLASRSDGTSSYTLTGSEFPPPARTLPLAAEHGPAEALARWMQRYAAFIATKRGLAAALHSGDPAFDALPDYFQRRLLPAFRMLLGAAAKTGDIRGDVDPNDLLSAIGRLGMGAGDDSADQTRRIVSLLVDGLRYGAGHPGSPAVARRGAGG